MGVFDNSRWGGRILIYIMKICGIYKITSPAGRIYIGQSRNIKRRFYRYRIFDCVAQSKLYRSFKKYGIKSHSFEILHECQIHQLNDLEKYYIKKFDSFDSQIGLNLQSGGHNGSPSKESRIKNSISNKGKIVSPETRKKISDSHKGLNTWTKGRVRPLSERMRLSESRKGDKNPFFGKKHSEETRLKFANRRASDETKRKFSEIRKNKLGENNPLSKIIFNTQNGIFYYGIKSAAESIGMKEGTLGAKLSGRHKNNTNLIYA